MMVTTRTDRTKRKLKGHERLESPEAPTKRSFDTVNGTPPPGPKRTRIATDEASAQASGSKAPRLIPKTNAEKARKESKRKKVNMKKKRKEEATSEGKASKKEKGTGSAVGGKARQRTWLIVHLDPAKPPSKLNINLGALYSSMKLYGGPLWFLSNFADSSIFDPDLHADHIFLDVEQVYHYARALLYAEAPVVDNVWSPPTPSDEMHHVILLLKRPSDIAAAGRSYDEYAKAHPHWAAYWKGPWENVVYYVLNRAVCLKFDQNPDLRQLLLKTGEYELVEASKGDTNCGTGFSATDLKNGALGRRSEWGQNLLGKILMGVRKFYREEDGHDGKFDRKYFDEMEREHDELLGGKGKDRHRTEKEKDLPVEQAGSGDVEMEGAEAVSVKAEEERIAG
ncbi:hypothetical protein LTR85_002802 [Meristemomyces frigidus]|nr:hypothetical protein LTR85_002802 [Meristemomyces frigidus]